MKTKLMVIIAILLASLVCYIPAEAVQTLDLFSDQSIGMGLDYRDGNRVLRSSTVKINPDVIEAMEGVEKGHDLSSIHLSMTFFFETPMVAVFNRWERVSPTSLALIGYIHGIPGSEVLFVTNGSMMTGTITLPGQLFQIKPVENVIHELQEIDPKSYPEHLEPIPVPAEQGFSTLDFPFPDDGTQIDVMVVYTAAARDAAGSTTAIESQIDLAVVETNQGYANSGVTQRIRLVHKEEINYSESSFDWNTALNRLQNTTDGYMDNVHALRDTYHADVVVMIVSANNYCGLGYLDADGIAVICCLCFLSGIPRHAPQGIIRLPMKWDTIWVLITIGPLVVRGLMSILTAISHPTRPSALSWPTIVPAVASGSITGLILKSFTMDNQQGFCTPIPIQRITGVR